MPTEWKKQQQGFMQKKKSGSGGWVVEKQEHKKDCDGKYKGTQNSIIFFSVEFLFVVNI